MNTTIPVPYSYVLKIEQMPICIETGCVSKSKLQKAWSANKQFEKRH